jgi:hypothetical protein
VDDADKALLPDPKPEDATVTPAPAPASGEAEAFQKVREHLTHPGTFAHLGAEAKQDLERLAHLLGEWRKHLL